MIRQFSFLEADIVKADAEQEIHITEEDEYLLIFYQLMTFDN
nr:hypothetical protein [Bacillus atrophaeus]